MTENNTKHTAYKIAVVAILILLIVSIIAVAPVSAGTKYVSKDYLDEITGVSFYDTGSEYRYSSTSESARDSVAYIISSHGMYYTTGSRYVPQIQQTTYMVLVPYTSTYYSYTPEATISVSPSSVNAGGTVTVTYTFADFDESIAMFGSDFVEGENPLGATGTILTSKTGTSGSGTFTFTAPSSAGSHQIYVYNGPNPPAVATASYTVIAPTPTPTPKPTDPTGGGGEGGGEEEDDEDEDDDKPEYLGVITASPATVAVGESVEVSYSIRKSGQWKSTDKVMLEVLNPEHYGVYNALRFFNDESNQFDYKLKYAGGYTIRIVSYEGLYIRTIAECYVTATGETPSEYQPMETEGLRATQTTVDSSELINIDYYTSEAGEISITENGKTIYSKTHGAAGGGTIGVTHITTDTDKTYTYKLYRGTTEIGSITLTWRAAPYNPPEITVSGHISTTAPKGEGLSTYSLNIGETATVTYRLKSPGEASLRYSEEYPSFKNNNRIIDIDTATYKGETASISGSFEVKYDKPGYYTYYLWAGDDYRLNGVAYPVSTITICVNSNPTTGAVRIDEVTAYVGSRLPVHYDGYSDNGEIGLYVMKPSSNSYELVAGMAQDFGTFIAALFNRPLTLTGKIDYTFDEVGTYTFAMYKGKANELTSSNLLGSDTIVIMQIPTPEALSDDFWGLGSYDGTYDIANYLQAVNWIRQVSVPSSIVTHFNIKSPSAYMSAYDVPYQSVSWFDNSIGQLITGLYNIVNTLSFPIRYVFNVTFGVINAFSTTFGWATSQLSIPIMLITLVTELIPDEIMNVALLLFGFDLFFLVLTVVAPGLVASASAVMGRNGFQRMDTPDEPPSEAESKKHEEAKTNAGVLNSNTEYNGFIDNMMDGK